MFALATKTLAGICAGMLMVSAPAQAQESEDGASAHRYESEHEGRFGGTDLTYRAIVAEHFIRDEKGRKTAGIFTTSYIRIDAGKRENRPVLFVFNGGPGSASLWLHMGFVGPKRVAFDNVVEPETTPPFEIVHNPDSPLDIADIVLIDPPGTGFSRILADGSEEDFYGVDQDARTTADVIRSWIERHGRWNSPRYILSESYGTVRAAALTKLLAGGPTETGGMDAITFNGAILLGQAMNHSNAGDLAYAMALPSLSATACYHGKLSRDCSSAEQVTQAQDFAAQSYVEALFKGARLSDEQRDQIATRLSDLTGLSQPYILAQDLRVTPAEFAQELLAEEGRELGRYDSRYTLPLDASGGDPVSDDPAMGQYVPAFVAAQNTFLRKELGMSIDREYEPIAFREVNARWDYGHGPGVPASRNFAEDLAVAMRRNPNFRLMVGTGYYDLVTTLGEAEYVVTHSKIPLKATTVHHYASGHMPYLGDEARRSLARDVRQFIGEP